MTGLVILAAGESSRLGAPKQKLRFNGKSLLQRVTETAVNSVCKPVIVILGAYAEEVQSQLKEQPVLIYHNLQWQEGMASSIRLGIKMLQQTEPGISAVILMVCDQPHVSTILINGLINKKAATEKQIVASFYNNTLGVPVLFDKKMFPELLSLKGEEGAKRLLLKHKESLVSIPFALGSIDIDTAKDYEALIS